MTIENWSDNIIVVELGDDPQFADDLTNLLDQLEQQPRDVVLNFSEVAFVNSSNIAKLLRLRKKMLGVDRWLVLCGITAKIKSVFAITGLDKIFQFTGDITTALATIQIMGEDK
jgi:anti-anti-sigma factor